MAELYYDPYDFEIDTDPHPVWRRMRDEAPCEHDDGGDHQAQDHREDRNDSKQIGALGGLEVFQWSLDFDDAEDSIPVVERSIRSSNGQ